jgi:hypothetical protein
MCFSIGENSEKRNIKPKVQNDNELKESAKGF